MIKHNTICLFGISVIFMFGSMGTLLYFADQVNQDLKINSEYVGYDSNTTNYNIVKNNLNYYGFVSFQYSNKNCSLFVYSDNLEIKVDGYLKFNYPLYIDQFIWYKNDNSCALTRPSSLVNNTALTIIFSFSTAIFIFCVIGMSINMYDEYKN